MTTRNRTAHDATSTEQFVERALIDFELDAAFRSRLPAEQAQWLRWIAAAPTERAEEYRVSLLLDALAREVPAAT